MFCGQHKLEGMVNVVLKRCAHEGCETFPSFGLPGQPGVQFCRLHKTPGMARRTSNSGDHHRLCSFCSQAQPQLNRQVSPSIVAGPCVSAITG